MTRLKNLLARMPPAVRQAFDARAGYTAAAADDGRQAARWPLNAYQQRLLAASAMDPDSALYTISCALRLVGPLDPDGLRAAVDAVVQRHPLLRSRVEQAGSRAFFVVQGAADTPFTHADLSGLPESEREAAWQGLVHTEASYRFDLAKETPLRVAIYGLGLDEHVLHLAVHHVVADQWSLEVMRRDLVAAYVNALQGRSTWLGPPLEFHARAQRDPSSPDDPDVRYWSEALRGTPTHLALPGRPPTPEGRRLGSQRYIAYGDLAEGIDRLGREHDCTTFMVLLAALAVAVTRWTGQEEFCLGTRVAGRHRAEDRDVVAFFVNLLALRFSPDGRQTTGEFLAAVREQVVEAFAHQHVPFETVLDALRVTPDAAVTPLIPIVITYQNVPVSPARSEPMHIDVRPLKVHNGSVRTELDFSFEGQGASLELAFEFRDDMFDEARAMSLVDLHRRVLAAMIDAPAATLDRIACEDDGTARHRLAGIDASPVPVLSIDGLMSRWAAERGEDEAVFDGDRRLTFRQWWERSGSMAAAITERLPSREGVVALHLRRSIEWLLCMSACMRSGHRYLALDAAAPAGYNARLLSAAGASLVIVDDASVAYDVATVTCDALGQREALPPTPFAPSSDDTAYLIFTSGSTGESKPVAIPWRQVSRCVASFVRQQPPGRDAVIAQRTTAIFAPAAKEWLIALACGIPLVIVPAEASVDMAALASLVERHAITHLHVVPSQLRSLLANATRDRAPWASLRCLVVAGEVLSPDLADTCHEVLPAVRLLDNYGCSELNDIYYADVQGTGTAVDNTRIYLLDEALAHVPAGVPGAIYVSGDSLGEGYPGHPGMTAAAWLPDPFSGIPSDRMFRTGDMGRLRDDGRLELLGRRDDVVKINGCRVEPRQVEAALLARPGVAGAVVLGHVAANGDGRLTAFVRPARDDAGIDDLRRQLALRLPHYMKPSRIVSLDAFPALPNGKIDRVALAAMAAEPPPAEAHVHGETARRLKDLWERVLGHGNLDGESDFFLAGGNSLSASLLSESIMSEFDVRLSLNDMFGISTLAGQAALIETARAGRNEP
ncbi:AMP-binding enzyme family protein [Xanthomonas citri pv. mangiferaeindicae LMG 941]|uniref:non-ribosomal peptide synthetase n=1 Tax=Xanthomonas citri TaxID=346 RepID=UPI0002552ADC|nr:condensation domain-containing protein [Xanthomonas citri]CCG36471.1 AMP-binding enzyme family protein [Xanthomonas citri pv. mangiferaeindicae LMG 941]